MTPHNYTPETLLSAILSIARDAGAAALTHYANLTGVTIKDDRSPVTAADHAAQKVIVAGLSRIAPDIPIVAEEDTTNHAREIRKTYTRFFLVDPLDGTKEFIKKSGEFTVNIALIDGSESVLGVVYAPAIGLAYFAARGAGAWKQRDAGTAERISAATTAASPLRIAISRDHVTDDDRALLTRAGNPTAIPMGSSLKFCLVAEGGADLYARFGPTMEWDTAAAQCVVEEAGARVTTRDGSPLTYNKESLRNPSVFCFADASVAQLFRE